MNTGFQKLVEKFQGHNTSLYYIRINDLQLGPQACAQEHTKISMDFDAVGKHSDCACTKKMNRDILLKQISATEETFIYLTNIYKTPKGAK